MQLIVANLHDKNEYIFHIRSLRQVLDHELVVKEAHRVIKFNQKAWLKSYVDINTELRKFAKYVFERKFLKLMNNLVFGKTIENVKKHRDIKLVTTKTRKNYLSYEPNYHTTKLLSKKLLRI